MEAVNGVLGKIFTWLAFSGLLLLAWDAVATPDENRYTQQVALAWSAPDSDMAGSWTNDNWNWNR